jgi:hypothetical protein
VAVDFVTVAASAATGAIAGGLVSWIAAPHVAGRQQRGQRRSDALRRISELVAPALTDVRQYQDHARGNLMRDNEKNSLHSSDITLCSQLLSASGDLPRWRRVIVKRRLVRLFGPATVDICAVHGDFGNNGEAALGILLNRQLNAVKNPDRFKQPDRGEFDRALRCDPDAKEVAALITSLHRLKNAR